MKIPYAAVLAAGVVATAGLAGASSAKSSKDKKKRKTKECTIADLPGLRSCLRGDPDEPRYTGNVTIIDYTGEEGGANSTATNRKNRVAPKLSFFEYDDKQEYSKAKFCAHGFTRNPTAIFFAESKEEVIIAVECASENGYPVAPRGRGHSYQGLSNMEGHLTVDLSLMCNLTSNHGTPEGYEDGWILGENHRGEKQEVIGTITAGAGCTNAIMLAEAAQEFSSEKTGKRDGIMLTGSCPSVGITGMLMHAIPFLPIIGCAQ